MASSGSVERIDYVELLVSEISRSKDFYGRAFGWTFQDYGPDYCEFNDRRLKGGFAKRVAPAEAGSAGASPGAAGSRAGPLVVLLAGDLEAARDRVEAAGGTIVKRIFEFPGGRRFHFADPDGYELAVWSDR